MKRAIALLLLLGIPRAAHAAPPRPPLAVHVPAIIVASDRVVLGDLSPTAPRALLEVDVAPSPAPGRQMVISREAVRAALRRAGAAEAMANGLPAQQLIERAAVDLTAAGLRTEVEAALAPKLPLGVSMGEILGLQDLTLPVGPLRVDVRSGRLQRSAKATVSIFVSERLVATQMVTIHLVGSPQTPTLRNDLPRGAMVTASDVELTSHALEQLPNGVVTKPEDLVGMRLTQPGRAGRPLPQGSVKVPPTIQRGATVTVVLRANGLRITRTAIAQSDGNIGDVIALKPDGDSGIIRGRIQSGEEVRIDFGGAF